MIIKIPKFLTAANIQIHHFNATFIVYKVYCGSTIRFGRALPRYPTTVHQSYAFSTILRNGYYHQIAILCE